MHGQRRQISLGFTPHRCPEGAHICHLYNDDKDRRRVVSPFVHSGMEERDAVEYWADVNAADQLPEILDALGIAEAAKAKREQLKFATAMEKHCPDGRFVPDTVLAQLGAEYARAIADKYAGVRVAAEMSWALRGIPGSERLIEYENGVNALLSTHPLTMVCQYDVNRFDGATVFDILIVHPLMVFRGEVMANPFFTASDSPRRQGNGASRTG
jgi:hypothetical protein